MHFLYKIINQLNGKVYIGQTIDDKRRWISHKSFAKQTEPVQYIHRAMAKYGIENFIFEVIATCRTQEDANEVEKILIIQYNSQDKEMGYNISHGGDPSWNRGLPKEQQPMYGKKQSDFQKQRMSEIHSGKIVIVSEETKRKISISLTGRSLSENCKEKIAAANRGKIVSKESREKMSKSKIGKTISNETRLKKSISMTGKFVGEKSYIAKLTWELAANIRKEYNEGNISQRKLAKKYNVSQSTIQFLIKNKTWKI